MDSLSAEQRREQVRIAEKAVQDQLDRIYVLIDENKAESIIQIEFKRYVERLSEKYNLLHAGLEEDKRNISESDYEVHSQQLKNQFSQDVFSVARALDTALTEQAGRQKKDNH